MSVPEAPATTIRLLLMLYIVWHVEGSPEYGAAQAKNAFCLKLDAMSAQEALATTFRILLMLYIILAHRWTLGVWACPIPRERLIGTPSAPHPLKLDGMSLPDTRDHLSNSTDVLYSLGTSMEPRSMCPPKSSKLDAMSVPETLATTIRILLMFYIVLAHRWNSGVWACPIPRERLIGTPSAPHRHPIGTPHIPGHPADPPDS